MQFWGDIILKHPELIGELPEGIIALNWGYDAGHPYDEEGEKFEAAGVPYYVCPGTGSWNSIAGRTDNTIANLREAAEQGERHGAVGYLMTDWGDAGHPHPLPVSYLGFAWGAALSWCRASNESLDLTRALDLHVFYDAAGVMGQLAYDLGKAASASKPLPNWSPVVYPFFRLVRKVGDYPINEMAEAEFTSAGNWSSRRCLACETRTCSAPMGN